MNPGCNPFESGRTMIHSIKTCNHGQQNLRGTDVRCRLLPPDMLLTGLKCHSVCSIPFGIFCDTDDASRNLSLELLFRCKICSMGSAITHRHTKSLCRAHYHIGSHFSGRCDQCQAHQFSRNGYKKIILFGCINQPSQILYVPKRIGILQEQSKQIWICYIDISRISYLYVDINGLHPASYNCKGLWMAIFRDKITVCSFSLLPLSLTV